MLLELFVLIHLGGRHGIFHLDKKGWDSGFSHGKFSCGLEDVSIKKFGMGPNPNGPLSKLLELLDTQVFSGSVDRGVRRWKISWNVWVCGGRGSWTPRSRVITSLFKGGFNLRLLYHQKSQKSKDV